jgi:hypothetical protein
MPELKSADEVYIYPYGGWHYHIKGCWMAPTDMPHKEDNYIPIPFKDIKKWKTNTGSKYVPDVCVERYEKDLPINPNPMEKK